MSPHDYSQPIKYTDIDTGEKEGPYCPKCFFDKERLSYAKIVAVKQSTKFGHTKWTCFHCSWKASKD
tara:strand:+ start:267 stop:467 length:201 start_codon:yes stop_codon:yes gene_type:complete